MSVRGRYLVTTLALAALAAGLVALDARSWRPAPRIERRAAAERPPRPPAGPPGAGEILQHREALALTAAQAAALEALARRWQADGREVEAGPPPPARSSGAMVRRRWRC